jgi:hypothetical protein
MEPLELFLVVVLPLLGIGHFYVKRSYAAAPSPFRRSAYRSMVLLCIGVSMIITAAFLWIGDI